MSCIYRDVKLKIARSIDRRSNISTIMRIFIDPVRSIGCTILGSVVATFALSCLAENRSISIGSIRNPSLLQIRGTFCDLQLSSDRQKRDVFLSAYQSQFQSTALMNIDGRDTILTSVREVKTKRGSIATYRLGNLNVKVNYLRTSPENEGASYDATITVDRGNKAKILAVTGACGI
jgi:hypothetical protein